MVIAFCSGVGALTRDVTAILADAPATRKTWFSKSLQLSEPAARPLDWGKNEAGSRRPAALDVVGTRWGEGDEPRFIVVLVLVFLLVVLVSFSSLVLLLVFRLCLPGRLPSGP